jgi:hypothetical protein
VSAPALAQTPGQSSQPSKPAAATEQDYHGDYVFGINAFDRILNRGETTTYSPGWFAGASYRVTRIISVVGELGGDYKKSRGLVLSLHVLGRGALPVGPEVSAREAVPAAPARHGSRQRQHRAEHPEEPLSGVTPGGGLDVRLVKPPTRA